MEQDDTGAAGADDGHVEAPADKAEQNISTGRKVRLALMLAILVALTVATVLYRASLERQERQEREQLAAGLSQLREALRAIQPDAPPRVLRARFADAAARYYAVKELDPMNVEADRLGVALCYAQGDRLETAVELFNGLDAKKIAAEIDPDAYARAVNALDDFPQLTSAAAGSEIHDSGREYLQHSGFLWGVARAIVPAQARDRDKALRLLQWMALHLGPARTGDPPADPFMSVFRGYAAPAEAAWTFAELARQADLRCRVASVPASAEGGEPLYLVQVEPAEGDPLLVDPYRGIPLVDPTGGEPLSLDGLASQPDAYGRLMALGGSRGPAPEFDAAVLRTALHPYACFPRFLAFGHLLSVLPTHPHVAARPTPLAAEGPLKLWEMPMNLLDAIGTTRPTPAAQLDYTVLQMVQGPRIQALQGHVQPALAACEALLKDLRDKRAQAELPEGAELLDQALERATFLAASAAFQAGRTGEAAEQLKVYLDHYPSGRWRTLAAAQLAECLSAAGDAAAAQLWGELPEPRRLYGALRAKGLMPGPPAAVPAETPTS